jgi:chaperonin GroES
MTKLGKDKVLIERVPAPDITSQSGLRIPDASKERPDAGKVIAVGSKVKDWEIGDTVIYPKWSGFQVSVPGDDRDLLVLFSDEIWMTL